MKEALRLKSKSGIHRLITGLEERGFLRRLPHRARALQVLKLPEAAAMPAPNVTPLLDSRRGMAEPPRRLRFLRSCAASGCRSLAPFRPPTRRRRSACRSTVGSPPAPRSGRCATIPRLSTCRSRCSVRARTIASRSRATRWSRPASRTATSLSSAAPTRPSLAKIVVALIDDSEATLKRPAQEGRLDRARAGQRRLRDAHFSDPDRVKIQGRLAGSLSPLSLALFSFSEARVARPAPAELERVGPALLSP